ncbi:hypothetical protein OESDEN_07232 [Oesophagostomum dentatum]|uniref:Immunoglobulin I-set domain-containing protein n=1 Tax=Oesophagostomum dentatum TaxID=61180 RepID=A0A0B1TAL9_OESDE|nr:hypothetical protein OESDEN_07232 [Oesophagostomum dentatum]
MKANQPPLLPSSLDSQTQPFGGIVTMSPSRGLLATRWITQTKDEATLKISACQQEDVAEYKIEASNPAGKASSVANLVLTREFSFHMS